LSSATGPVPRVLVTGVGRSIGIAATVADRLRADGRSVVTTGFRGYDAKMPWGADPQPLADHEVDFADPAAPDALFDALAGTDPITAMVMCHLRER
jgi:3-oxoacyl-[acyl-carrier protein] reductase